MNPAPEQRSLLPQVGAYVIEGIIGEGAVAYVYRARHAAAGTAPPGSADVVALKVLRPEAVRQAQVLASFQYEARVLARLRHSGILRLYDFGEDRGKIYAATELIDGTGLDSYLLAKKRLPAAVAVDLATQIAHALDYLHGRGYIHRDLKPSNVLLAQEGRAVLSDFGTVIRTADGAPYEVGVYGTPAFLAPEQIHAGGYLDGRVDLYALGIILYLMVAGRKPFYGARTEVLEAHQRALPPPPSTFAPVTPDLETVILRCLEKAPEKRFQSGAELAQALQNAAIEQEQPASPSWRRRLLDRLRAGS